MIAKIGSFIALAVLIAVCAKSITLGVMSASLLVLLNKLTKVL